MKTAQKSHRGGWRPNAGRKPGNGTYGEPTMPIRVPVSRLPQVRGWLQQVAAETFTQGKLRPVSSRPTSCPLALYGSRIAAGFPSPADDHLERPIDLNEHLVRHPAATFVVRVEGDSMTGVGIHHNDLLVVDRSLDPVSGAIVVAVVDGELTVKRLRIQNRRIRLAPENPAYDAIEIGEASDLRIWGVVTHVIHSF